MKINSNSTDYYLKTRSYYTGSNAVTAYRQYIINAGGNVTNTYGIPIEDDGGSGTSGGHPEENETAYHDGCYHPALMNELMTGYISNSDNDGKLSKITIGFLQDMGYNVNTSLADSYSIVLPSDITRPSVTISSSNIPGGTGTNSNNRKVLLTFSLSENVSNFSLSDITFTNCKPSVLFSKLFIH